MGRKEARVGTGASLSEPEDYQGMRFSRKKDFASIVESRVGVQTRRRQAVAAIVKLGPYRAVLNPFEPSARGFEEGVSP